MSEQQKHLLEWAEKTAVIKPPYTDKQYPKYTCFIMNLFDARLKEAKCECAWTPPYGFVPEPDCPEHDVATAHEGR